MWSNRCIIFTLLSAFTQLDGTIAECDPDSRSPELTWESRLTVALNERCPSKKITPPNPRDTNDITVKFLLKNFFFNDREEVFTIYSWILLSWHDDRLAWKATDYGAITETIVHANSIWTPTLKLLNAKTEDSDDFIGIKCSVRSSGDVQCVPRVFHEVACISRLGNWPYDQQKCRLEFGSLGNNFGKFKDNVTFILPSRGMRLWEAEYGTGWMIVDFKQEINVSTSVQFYFELTVERQAEDIAAILLGPCIALTILTISSLFLDITDSLRVGIISLSIIGHFSLIQTLNSLIPQHSAESPTVLIYLRASLITTTTCLIVTVILSKLVKRQGPTHSWMSSINIYVSRSLMRHLVLWHSLGGDQILADEITRRHEDERSYFASICNSVGIVVSLVMYICSYILYIPRPLPSE
ncbi:acetylcholine receptor subunit beta-type unc-29-like [Leptidea sinapis]|uniref:acetylcholine receptor subunit beta-type unc-29-like n=1 Tax=Leptidea sinapis TaxID=189913 RepID=UPI0021C397CC|nr:acetylcholine receptor subunit beta-type unc-29-like [Leptidea sinapis]